MFPQVPNLNPNPNPTRRNRLLELQIIQMFLTALNDPSMDAVILLKQTIDFLNGKSVVKYEPNLGVILVAPIEEMKVELIKPDEKAKEKSVPYRT